MKKFRVIGEVSEAEMLIEVGKTEAEVDEILDRFAEREVPTVKVFKFDEETGSYQLTKMFKSRDSLPQKRLIGFGRW